MDTCHSWWFNVNQEVDGFVVRMCHLWVNANCVTVQLQLSAVMITITSGTHLETGWDSHQVHCDARESEASEQTVLIYCSVFKAINGSISGLLFSPLQRLKEPNVCRCRALTLPHSSVYLDINGTNVAAKLAQTNRLSVCCVWLKKPWQRP